MKNTSKGFGGLGEVIENGIDSVSSPTSSSVPPPLPPVPLPPSPPPPKSNLSKPHPPRKEEPSQTDESESILHLPIIKKIDTMGIYLTIIVAIGSFFFGVKSWLPQGIIFSLFCSSITVLFFGIIVIAIIVVLFIYGMSHIWKGRFWIIAISCFLIISILIAVFPSIAAIIALMLTWYLCVPAILIITIMRWYSLIKGSRSHLKSFLKKKWHWTTGRIILLFVLGIFAGISALVIYDAVRGRGRKNPYSQKERLLPANSNPAERTYYLSTTGVRHNRTCRYYNATPEYQCTKVEGRPCKKCGG